MKNLYFNKRVPEHSSMSAEEEQIFNGYMEENYKRIFFPFLRKVSDCFSQGDSILEIGSGKGLLIKALIELFNLDFKIKGLDYSQNMINQSRELLVDHKVDFIKGSADNLPFDDAIFDVVISKDSLHEFDNIDKVIGEVYRVLKPGGVAIMYDLRRDLPYKYLKECLKKDNVFTRLQYFSARAAYTKDELFIKFSRKGFFSINAVSPRVTKEDILKNPEINNPELLRRSFQTRCLLKAIK